MEENQSISIHLLNGGSPKIRKTTTACGCAPCQVVVFHFLQRPGCEQHTRTHICERATYCLFLERREGKRKYKQAGAIFSRVFSPGNCYFGREWAVFEPLPGAEEQYLRQKLFSRSHPAIIDIILKDSTVSLLSH